MKTNIPNIPAGSLLQAPANLDMICGSPKSKPMRLSPGRELSMRVSPPNAPASISSLRHGMFCKAQFLGHSLSTLPTRHILLVLLQNLVLLKHIGPPLPAPTTGKAHARCGAQGATQGAKGALAVGSGAFGCVHCFLGGDLPNGGAFLRVVSLYNTAKCPGYGKSPACKVPNPVPIGSNLVPPPPTKVTTCFQGIAMQTMAQSWDVDLFLAGSQNARRPKHAKACQL